jgi:hypothetical protein
MEIFNVRALARRWIQLLLSEYQNCPAEFDLQFERGMNFGPESTGCPSPYSLAEICYRL